MPLSSPVQNAPTALQLNNAAVDALPDYTHPLTEELVRKIAAGELTGEQAFAQAQAHVQQFNQPAQAPQQQGAMPTPGAAPVQQASLGAAPAAPQQAAPQAPQAPMQAPQQVQQVQQVQQPMRAPSIAPEIPGAPGAAPSLGGAQPQPPPANNQQADPQANANNLNAAPSFDANLSKGRNQIGDALTNTLPERQRTQVPQGGMNAQGAQGGGAQAPATGYAAARNAIYGLGPRMTNKDVAVFMDAFVKGGKPAIEMEKERGRAFRAEAGNSLKSRGLDLKEQGLADQFDIQRNRLSFDKEREANKLALHLEDLEMQREKLAAMIRRAKESGYDRFELQRMKDAAALVRSTMGAAAQVGASMQSEAPAGSELLNRLKVKLDASLEEAERISNYAIANKSDANAPASSLGTQALNPGPVAPATTTGEAAKKVSGQKQAIQSKPKVSK